MDLSIFKCQKKILTSKLFTNHDSLNNLSGFYIFLRHGWTYFPGPILLCVQYEDFITMNTLSEFLKFPKSHFLLTNLWNAKKYYSTKRTKEPQTTKCQCIYYYTLNQRYMDIPFIWFPRYKCKRTYWKTIIPKYVDFDLIIWSCVCKSISK